MKSRRLFAGVPVAASNPLKHLLADLKGQLAEEAIRWVSPENLHLTVEFFGATADALIPVLAGALGRAAGDIRAFQIQPTGVGIFGSSRHPRVLWLGIRAPGLLDLHARVAEVLRTAGWPPEKGAYFPHLTLGRVNKRNHPRQILKALESRVSVAVPGQTIRELILFESVSGRHVPLQRWPLAGGG